MTRTTKSLIALLVLVAMCVSFCVPTFAEATAGEHEHTEDTTATATCPGEEQRHTFANCSSYTKLGTTKPVCGVSKGYTEYKCNVCGDKFVEDIAEFNKHDYKVEKDGATCTAPGKIKYTCNQCGHSYEETVTELGHTWGDWYYAEGVFCDETGRHYVRDCEVCGEQDQGLWTSNYRYTFYSEQYPFYLRSYSYQLCFNIKKL